LHPSAPDRAPRAALPSTSVYLPEAVPAGGGVPGKFATSPCALLPLRGPRLQVNVVGGKQWRPAPADPDRRCDLTVRVRGLLERFLSLRPEYQEEFFPRPQRRP